MYNPVQGTGNRKCYRVTLDFGKKWSKHIPVVEFAVYTRQPFQRWNYHFLYNNRGIINFIWLSWKLSIGEVWWSHWSNYYCRDQIQFKGLQSEVQNGHIEKLVQSNTT